MFTNIHAHLYLLRQSNAWETEGRSVNEKKTWRKFANEKIKLVGSRIWMNNNSDRLIIIIINEAYTPRI